MIVINMISKETILIMIYITLGIGMLGWMLSIILAKIGHCQIGWGGDELWENKKCEWLYYHITAPISFIFLITAIVLCLLTPFSK